MRRHGLGLLAFLGLSAFAVAQVPYSPVQQPISPYLNLLNGGTPGLNYFYGVRPLTIPGGGSVFGNNRGQALPPNGFGMFQPIYGQREPQSEPEDAKKFRIPSAGGAVGFGNYFGSSNAGLPSGGASGGGGPNRPASGSTIPPARTGTVGTPNAIPKSK